MTEATIAQPPQQPREQETLPVVERCIKSFQELPQIGDFGDNSDPLWAHPKLRPGSERPSYDNIPVLNFGVRMMDGYAELTVPAAAYVNAVVDMYNPGGFHFTETEGYADAEDFLSLIQKKEFPYSTDKLLEAFRFQDPYEEFLTLGYQREDDREEPDESFHEHDRVEHTGLALLDAAGADNIADFVTDVRAFLAQSRTPEAEFSATLDVLLTELSDYALIPVTDTSDSTLAFREFSKQRIGRLQAIVNYAVLHGSYKSSASDGSDAVEMMSLAALDMAEINDTEAPDYYAGKLKEIGWTDVPSLEVDLDAFEASIARIQALPAIAA